MDQRVLAFIVHNMLPNATELPVLMSYVFKSFVSKSNGHIYNTDHELVLDTVSSYVGLYKQSRNQESGMFRIKKLVTTVSAWNQGSSMVALYESG